MGPWTDNKLEEGCYWPFGLIFLLLPKLQEEDFTQKELHRSSRQRPGGLWKKAKKFSRFRSTGGFNWPQFWWKCGGSHLLPNLIKVYFQIQMGHQILCRKNRKLILAHGTTTKSDYVILAINVPYVFVNAHFLFRFFFHLV